MGNSTKYEILGFSCAIKTFKKFTWYPLGLRNYLDLFARKTLVNVNFEALKAVVRHHFKCHQF